MEDCNLRQKIIFLTFQDINPNEGIGKKILSQVNALKLLGFDCLLGRFVAEEDYSINYYIGDEKIECYGKGFKSKLEKCYRFSKIGKYIIENKDSIAFVYVRYTQFANIFSVFFFKQLKINKIKIVLEIPTYPYDGESKFSSIKDLKKIEEKTFRKKLISNVERIVTFSSDKEIWGKKTIKIDNAIDLTNIPLRQKVYHEGELNLIGVASLAFWHGFDRVIEGLYLYNLKNAKTDVRFHIVGGSPGQDEFEKLRNLSTKYKLHDKIIFYGSKSGAELDEIFNHADVAIGCLGCHRKNIKEVQSLKNVEYAARGIPFVYSEINKNFDNQEYVFKVSADDMPIDIESIVAFRNELKIKSEQIRETVKSFNWCSQMNKIISTLA